MEKATAIPAKVEPAGEFYRLIGKNPGSEAEWADRQATLRRWRSEARFEPYWPCIDQMLTDDYAAFRHRAAAMDA